MGVPNFNSNALNIEVTETEIMSCIKNLKNGKCPGTDEIINEYIKISCPVMLPIYVKLFNMILDTGNIPESWLIGVIKPLYKNKGDPTLPENYRPSFRASYSTTDNIFVIHALIEYLRVRKLKLYCAFIDFTKAFDNVWRVGLWGKLLSYLAIIYLERY